MKVITPASLKRATTAANRFGSLYPVRPRLEKSADRRILEKALGGLSAEIRSREFKRVVAEHRKQLDRLVQRGETAAIRQARQLIKPLRHNIEAQFKAVSQLASGKLQLGPPVYIMLDKPFLIWAQPSNILYDSRLIAGQSFAKIKIASNKSSKSQKYPGGGSVPIPDTLSFYFLWQNPSDYY